MTQTEIITVVGISQKSEKKEGWVSCHQTNTPSWKTLLIPFNKEILGSVLSQLGVYEVKLNNLSSAFGGRPKYEIAEAKLIISFDEILKLTNKLLLLTSTSYPYRLDWLEVHLR